MRYTVVAYKRFLVENEKAKNKKKLIILLRKKQKTDCIVI